MRAPSTCRKKTCRKKRDKSDSSTDTPPPGFADGFARSINRAARDARATPMSISTSSLGSSVCLCFRKTFRGRRHDVLSESRMR